MELLSAENCLFVPHSGGNTGDLYELEPAAGFAENSFVIIPYQNPQVKKPQPRYYRFVRKTEITGVGAYKSEAEAPPIQVKSLTGKQRYYDKIKELQREIGLGNIYEINYCQSFFCENAVIDPVDVFLKLNALAKAPYACILKLGGDYIISASPELFLKREGNIVYTKPIKGTTRRGQDPAEDERLKKELQESIKERTENVMAVDVARNDLSRFAARGSVQVNKLYNIETFETVHQMVSTVRCEIGPALLNNSPAGIFNRIIEDTFPMASMTGAPKLRAMQLIDTHEDFERGCYSGAMGLVDADGNFLLQVLIRSIFYNAQTGRLHFAVGGAITCLSEAEKEYEECLLKAGALLKVLNASIAP